MIKEYKEIIKNYYELIKDDKKKLIPYYIVYFLNVIVGLIIPIYVAKITEYITKSLFTIAIIGVIMYLLLRICKYIFSFFNKYIYQYFYQHNYITLHKKIVNKIYAFDEEYKKKLTSGRILNTLTTDVINIGEMADNILTIILNILTSIIIIIYLFNINIYITILIFIINIIYIKRNIYLNNMVIKYAKEQRLQNDKIIGLVNQTLLGLKDIKTLDISSSINSKYNLIYKSWKEVYNNKKKYERYVQTILKCILVIMESILYLICIYLIMNNKMSIGTMLIVIAYFKSFFESSDYILDAIVSMKDQNISVNRIKEILEYNTFNNEKLDNIKNINGLIEFKKVNFSYNEKSFLQNLNFSFKPNNITAIVGDNGAGKTTIINLILRLYSPSKGEILLDNKNINEINMKSYLREISVLNQDTYLFNYSIRQNFNLITKDVMKQKEICKLVGIDKFIEKLPNGYDTVIDENSHNISGGQKRLISLARTLLKESKILIFDEATSSLDKDMIQNFINILKNLKKNHTVILITHKKELIKVSDKIITISNHKKRSGI